MKSWYDDLLDVGDRGDMPTEADVMDQDPSAEPQYLQLQLKKKHATALLKRMLAEGGYGDLARMTNIRRGSIEEGDE